MTTFVEIKKQRLVDRFNALLRRRTWYKKHRRKDTVFIDIELRHLEHSLKRAGLTDDDIQGLRDRGGSGGSNPEENPEPVHSSGEVPNEDVDRDSKNSSREGEV